MMSYLKCVVDYCRPKYDNVVATLGIRALKEIIA